VSCSSEKLSALLDGDLSSREASLLRAHAESCAACTRMLGELSALKIALDAERAHPPEPMGDGWAELAARLGPTGPAPRSRWRWLWAPTAALACALVILAVRQTLRPRGPSDDQLIAQAEAEFHRADAQYQHAVEKIRAVAQKQTHSPQFAEAQAKLDAAVEECRTVARERPSDADAEQLLFAAYRKQMDFYERQLVEARR
jgi:anti-sigma factor RsiW